MLHTGCCIPSHRFTRAGHFQLPLSPLGQHEDHKQSKKRCSLLFCFDCLLHIQRGPWCPFPHLSLMFWAQNSNSTTCSYRINKEMNHNSLDEDRTPKPSNPETAYIHRHGQCCCGFYSKPGNAALRLQQGKAISRPMHVLQLKLELCISRRLVSLSKNTYFPTQPIILNKIDASDRDTCKNSTAAPVHQHCNRPLEV